MKQTALCHPTRAPRGWRPALAGVALVVTLAGCASSQSDRWAQNAPTIAPAPRSDSSAAADIGSEIVHLGVRGPNTADPAWSDDDARP